MLLLSNMIVKNRGLRQLSEGDALSPDSLAMRCARPSSNSFRPTKCDGACRKRRRSITIRTETYFLNVTGRKYLFAKYAIANTCHFLIDKNQEISNASILCRI